MQKSVEASLRSFDRQGTQQSLGSIFEKAPSLSNDSASDAYRAGSKSQPSSTGEESKLHLKEVQETFSKEFDIRTRKLEETIESVVKEFVEPLHERLGSIEATTEAVGKEVINIDSQKAHIGRQKLLANKILMLCQEADSRCSSPRHGGHPGMTQLPSAFPYISQTMIAVEDHVGATPQDVYSVLTDIEGPEAPLPGDYWPPPHGGRQYSPYCPIGEDDP